MYEIEYGTDDTNFTTVDTGSRDTHYNLTGLQHNTTYHIRVVAVNYLTFGGTPLRGNESETVTDIVRPEPGEDDGCWIQLMDILNDNVSGLVNTLRTLTCIWYGA